MGRSILYVYNNQAPSLPPKQLAVPISRAPYTVHSVYDFFCSTLLMMVGQAQQDIASQMANYELAIGHDVIIAMNTMIEVQVYI